MVLHLSLLQLDCSSDSHRVTNICVLSSMKAQYIYSQKGDGTENSSLLCSFAYSSCSVLFFLKVLI